MKIAVYNTSGQEVKQIELADDVFAVPMNTAAVHQTVVAQRNNARQEKNSLPFFSSCRPVMLLHCPMAFNISLNEAFLILPLLMPSSAGTLFSVRNTHEFSFRIFV